MASLCYLIIILPLLISSTTSTPTIGVTYTKSRFTFDKPEAIATTIKSLNITAVRLPDPDPAIIKAFSDASISLLLSIPNSLIPSLARSRSNAASWLNTYVVPFNNGAHISTISVGSNLYSNDVLSAIGNLHYILQRYLGIRHISVSTTLSLSSTLTTEPIFFPPTEAQFRQPINDTFIIPLLNFLQNANSPLLVNVHPFNVYRNMTTLVPVGFALFQGADYKYNYRLDSNTQVQYRNLFDIMVDSVVWAIVAIGHHNRNIPLIVTETGWPSSPILDEGSEGTDDANKVLAELYLNGLLKHLRSQNGSTPLRKEAVSEVYIFELFNEINNVEPAGAWRWGILYPNLTSKYDLDFIVSGSSTGDMGMGFKDIIITIGLFLAVCCHVVFFRFLIL